MKILILNLLILSSLLAGYEKVRIGNIHKHYQNQITPTQLRTLLSEIENTFESQLGFNVFDYSQDGKPIDLLYLPPSKMEKRINRKIDSFNKKKEKLNKLSGFFPKKKKELDSVQKKYNIQADILNSKITNLNNYVREVNKIKQYPKKQYDEIKNYIKIKKDEIKNERKLKRSLERKLRKTLNQYNNKIHSYNNLVRQSSMLIKEIESLQRSYKVVRGKTFGQKEITLKTTIKNGKKYKERTTKSSMDKIEIYSFENLNQLKVILAHEIGHLVGIPHIDFKDALMNPILQKSQENRLFLTIEDIKNIKTHF